MKIGIAHCAFDLDRRERLRALRGAIPLGEPIHVSSSTEREPAHVWATRLWTWAAAQEDDVLLLNDDVEPCPNVVGACKAALDVASEADVLALHSVLAEAKNAIPKRQRFLRSFLVSGPAYVLRRGVARRLLAFSKRVDFEHLKEDNVLSYFAFHEDRPAWHTIPALVKHNAPSVVYNRNEDAKARARGEADPPDRPQDPEGRYAPAPWDAHPLLPRDDWRTEGEPALVDVPWLPIESLKAQTISMYLGVPMGGCWACANAAGEIGSPITGLMVCARCACTIGSSAMGELLKARDTWTKALEQAKAKQGAALAASLGPRVKLGPAPVPGTHPPSIRR